MSHEIIVEGYSPTTAQMQIIDAATDDTTKFIIACFGRQAGKSYTGMNLILKWALENNATISMWVSPVYSQAKKVFNELEVLVKDTGLLEMVNRSELSLTFINKSKIIFRSGEREDTLRGYTLDYLVVDEAAYIKDQVWDRVLRQTLFVKGKKALFISTPKGRNWFYTLAMKGVSNDNPLYKTLKATSYDTPFITPEELSEAKLSLPETIYKQEILAEFIDDGGEVFSNLKSICNLHFYPSQETTGKYYAGIDFGRQDDYTVMIILNEKGEMVDFYRERQRSWEVIISDIVMRLRKWRPQVFAEINSIGDVLYENIRKQYPAVQPFLTNQASKQNAVEDLILAMNEEKIRLPNKDLNGDLYNELSVFTYSYSPKSRKVSYGAPNGLHDDCVISLSLAYQAFKKKMNHGSYVIR
jgi:hypothetical protein